MNKRIIALFIVFVMILGMVPIVFAVSEPSNGNKGSIKTTDFLGTAQNENHYDSKSSVYVRVDNMIGGPYRVEVRGKGSKTGNDLLGTGTVTITKNGEIFNLMSVAPFLDSENGVYSVVVGKSKNDNFKIKIPTDPTDPKPRTGVITVFKRVMDFEDKFEVPDSSTFTFALYEENAEEPMQIITIVGSGSADFESVPYGNYYVREINVPEGYSPISLEYAHSLKGNFSFEFRNLKNKEPDQEPETINITVEKRIIDGEGQSVGGFIFQLWQDNQLVYTFDETDSSGLTSLDVVPGSYTFVEALTPEQQEIFKEHPSSKMTLEENRRHIVNNVLKEIIPDPPKRAEYKVEHHRRDDVNDPYVLIDTDYKAGLIGGLTNAQANFYSGYYYNAFNQEVILADGSTVVKIYYDKIIDEEPELESDPEGVPHTIEKILLDHLGNRIGDDSSYFTIQLEQLIDDEWIAIKTYELKGKNRCRYIRYRNL